MKIKNYIFLIIFLFTLTISCQTIQSEKLIGSWKTRDLKDTTGQNAEDKITFTKNNIVIIEIVANGKIIEKEVANYSFKNDIIIIKFKDQYSDFKILKLNDSEMELLNIKEKTAIKYIR